MGKVVSDRKRVRKAVRIANRILLSYIGLHLSKKFFGKSYYQKRLSKYHNKNAKRVMKGISDLKGLFTKVGQLMSMMSNVLPEEYGNVLESLQDHAPPSPFESTEKIIQEDLGEPLANLFQEFEEQPIASASIGQVYKAKLSTGEEVAVKVQHEGIQELAEADLEIIRKMVKRVSFFIKIEGMEYIYEQVRKMVIDELDFRKEAKSMVIISENLKTENGISVPKLYDECSSERIITTAFQDAVKITNIKQLDTWGIDREELARRLILAYCKMILEDGFYHADPHPGNVFVREDGEIILLDFGATAVLSENMRKEIPVLIRAAIQNDNDKVVSSLQKMGFIGPDSGSRKVAKKVVETISYFLANEVDPNELNVANISIDDVKGSSVEKLQKELSIRELSKSVRVPKDWVLLDRTLILIAGISSSIAPKLDTVEVVKPYLKKQLTKFDSVKQFIIDAIKEQFQAILALPKQLDTFLRKANNGELEVEVKNNTEKLYALGQQFILVVLMLASIIFYYLAGKENVWIGVSITLGAFLLRSLWKNRKRP